MSIIGKIIVNKKATKGQLAVLARDALKVIGTVVTAKGMTSSDSVDTAIGIVTTAAPIVYSQLKTFWVHKERVVLADNVPDAIAEVK